MLRQLFFIVAVASLTACGTGSGGSSGSCEEITPYIVGGKSKFERTLQSGEKLIDYRETLERTNHSLRQILRIEGAGRSIKIDSKSEFYIKDHCALTTETVTKTSVSGGKIQTMKVTYDPYANHLPWNQACKGDEWNDTVTAKVGSYEVEQTTMIKVEDVNVEKTVEAGTFDTYILAWIEKDRVAVRWWFDMDTGTIVATENYDSKGSVESSGQLLEYID